MTRQVVMAAAVLATGIAVAGTTVVSSVEDMPASGGEGTIRYTGASGTVTKNVSLAPEAKKAATLEVPAETTLTFSGKLDVTTGAFIKTGAGTVKLPYIGSYSLGAVGAATVNAALTWNDGNAVNGFGALTVADGTVEAGAAGATVSRAGSLLVGVRHDCATDPTFKLVGGTMTAGDVQIDRGTSAGGKQTQPTLVVSGGASLTADNWTASTGDAASYTNNAVATVTGNGSLFKVTGYFLPSSVNGLTTLNVLDGGTFWESRGNMDCNTSIGVFLGGWDASQHSGLESRKMIVNVDGGTLKAETAYLYRYSEINVKGGGVLQLARPVQKINHDDIDAQRGALNFDNGTLAMYTGGVGNWFCGITNYTVGAGGMTVDLTTGALAALSGHASYQDAAAKTAGAEIVITNSDSYVALGAGAVDIRAGKTAALHMTVNGRLNGSSSTGRIRPAEGKNLVVTIAGDNSLQEMSFQASGRTRFRHQGIEADVKRWATVGAAMPMANGTLALGHQSEQNHRGAVWLRDKLPVNTSFKISWTYHQVRTSGYPYGIAAVFQNAGLTACGESGSGSSCCFAGIGTSVGMAYDVALKSLRYGEDGTMTDNTAFDGLSGAWSDDPIRLSLAYDATTKALVLSALQPTTGKTFSKTNTVDLAAKFGASAYFGFTGGTAAGCTGYHCIDDVRIDAEQGRGYQKVGGHMELAAGQTLSPEMLADEKNLGSVMKELVYADNARLNVVPSTSVGLPAAFFYDVNLGFDAIRGTGTLVKGGASALSLSAPGAATNASVRVQDGGLVLRHEEAEEPPFGPADGDWCFTGPEIYWRGPKTLQFGPLGNGSKSGDGAIHTMNANTRRRYRIDGDWKATFGLYGESVYGTDGVPYQGITFAIHNTPAGAEARAINLCGGFGGTLGVANKAAAFRFWTKDKFVTYGAASKWIVSSTGEGSHAFENGIEFTKSGGLIQVELVHNAAGNTLDLTMTQGAKTFTYRWENANLKTTSGGESLAYLSFGAMGHSTNPTFFRVSDFTFRYLDAQPPAVDAAYFGSLALANSGGCTVTLDAAMSNLTYRLTDSLSLCSGGSLSVKAKRSSGSLDLGTVTCAGPATVMLADGCTASLAAATGTEDFTVSGDTLTITSPTAFSEDTVLRLNNGAKLNLAFTGTLSVKRIFVDGVRQPSGNYVAGGASWIAGGTGEVRMGRGLAILVR